MDTWMYLLHIITLYQNTRFRGHERRDGTKNGTNIQRKYKHQEKTQGNATKHILPIYCNRRKPNKCCRKPWSPEHEGTNGKGGVREYNKYIRLYMQYIQICLIICNFPVLSMIHNSWPPSFSSHVFAGQLSPDQPSHWQLSGVWPQQVNVFHTINFLLRFSESIREMVRIGQIQIQGELWPADPHSFAGGVEATLNCCGRWNGRTPFKEEDN